MPETAVNSRLQSSQRLLYPIPLCVHLMIVFPTVASYPTLHPDDCVPFPESDMCRALVHPNMLQRQEVFSWYQLLMPCSPEPRPKCSAILHRTAYGTNRNDRSNLK